VTRLTEELHQSGIRTRELEAKLTDRENQTASLKEENDNLIKTLTEKTRSLERELETHLQARRKNEQLEAQIRDIMLEVDRIFSDAEDKAAGSPHKVQALMESHKKGLMLE
jgi:vacuolar-type H+-ATPase subunit H